MRAFYYLFILFNNLLSIHIHTPQAPDERRLCFISPHRCLISGHKKQCAGEATVLRCVRKKWQKTIPHDVRSSTSSLFSSRPGRSQKCYLVGKLSGTSPNFPHQYAKSLKKLAVRFAVRFDTDKNLDGRTMHRRGRLSEDALRALSVIVHRYRHSYLTAWPLNVRESGTIQHNTIFVYSIMTLRMVEELENTGTR